MLNVTQMHIRDAGLMGASLLEKDCDEKKVDDEVEHLPQLRYIPAK